MTVSQYSIRRQIYETGKHTVQYTDVTDSNGARWEKINEYTSNAVWKMEQFETEPYTSLVDFIRIESMMRNLLVHTFYLLLRARAFIRIVPSTALQHCLFHTGSMEFGARCGTYHQASWVYKKAQIPIIYIYSNNRNYIELNLIVAEHATQNPVFSLLSFFFAHAVIAAAAATFLFFSFVVFCCVAIFCCAQFKYGHPTPSSSS